jgi:hypothetical protein
MSRRVNIAAMKVLTVWKVYLKNGKNYFSLSGEVGKGFLEDVVSWQGFKG